MRVRELQAKIDGLEEEILMVTLEVYHYRNEQQIRIGDNLKAFTVSFRIRSNDMYSITIYYFIQISHRF